MYSPRDKCQHQSEKYIAKVQVVFVIVSSLFVGLVENEGVLEIYTR